MRNRLVSQVRQRTNICALCACHLSRDYAVVSRASSAARTFTSTRSIRSSAGQATAESKWDDDDDDVDFPMIKGGAAGNQSRWPSTTSTAMHRDAPLNKVPPVRSQPSLTQSGNKPQSGNDRNNAWQDRRHAPNGPSTFRRTNASRQDNPPQNDRSRNHFASLQDETNHDNNRFRINRYARPLPERQSTEGRSPQNSNRNPQRSPYTMRPSFLSQAPSDTAKTEPGLDPKIEPQSKVERQSQSQSQRRNQTEARLGNARPDSQKTTEYHPIAKHSPPTKTTAPESEPKSTLQERFQSRRGRFADADVDVHEHLAVGQASRRDKRTSQSYSANLPATQAKYRSKSEIYRGAAEKRFGGGSAATKAYLDDWEDEEELSRVRRKKDKKRQKSEQRPVVHLPEYMTVQYLAQSLKVRVDDLIRKLHQEGYEDARYDHLLDVETAAMFADIYGFDPVAAEDTVQDLVARPPPADPASLPSRPPIVTIMGHVDHGKTTILDWLRKSSVAAGEHGGITQHIGAFSVTMPGSERQITFLDTPGHEAFLDMRKRGANVTDIVVLVVAADDSVKPQTIEAIKHALEANVQLIVAINKVDKYDADIERVKSDLTQHDIVVEDFGGDYQAIPVSGKTGQGMEKLEEAIIALADVLDLRAEQDGPAEGSIIESKLTNAGRVATVLVRKGILRVADFIVAGPTWGRVRTLRNDAGQLVKEAFPGDPVQVDGWRGEDPTAGLEVLQANDEQHAKDVVALRHEKALISQAADEMAAINATKTQEAEARAKVLEWERDQGIKPTRRSHHEGWVEGLDATGPKPVPFIVKADVAGSVEAIVHAINTIGNHEVQAKVIHSGTGPLTESDIRMLATTGETCYAISFNQSVENAVTTQAYAANIEILNHNIIYRVTEAVKDRVQDALPPLITTKVLGEAEVGQIFDIKIKARQTQKIAGAKIKNGTISRANRVRLLRAGDVIYTGTIKSLKNVKKDVTEMNKGSECGIAFEEWEDVQPGDQIQCFEEIEEKRKLY